MAITKKSWENIKLEILSFGNIFHENRKRRHEGDYTLKRIIFLTNGQNGINLQKKKPLELLLKDLRIGIVKV